MHGCTEAYKLTNEGRVSTAGQILCSDYVFNAVHLLLVEFAVACGALFGLSEGVFKSFHALCSHTQTLLQLRQLAAQICVIPHQLERRLMAVNSELKRECVPCTTLKSLRLPVYVL